MAGTAERDLHNDFKSNLSEIMDIHTEASYQMVNQTKIVSKVWENARLAAEERYPDPNSSARKRLKFKLVPLALVIYV